MEVIAQALYAYLAANGPVDLTVYQLAQALGVTESQLNNTLWWLRKPEIVAWHGWTVPWQHRGYAAKEWRVVHAGSGGADELVSIGASDNQYRSMCAKMLLRNKALIDVAVARTNGRTREGREYRQVSRMLDGAAAMLGV
jgi:hypothetical protein